MLDKQKLLQWIEDKRYVYAVADYDHAAIDDSAEEIAKWQGCLKMLSMMEMSIRAGYMDVEATHDPS